MAGAGKKTFVAGEVLTAAQVNDYLMDQAVMRFSGSAARAASITAPTEGMVTYLDDSNVLEYYDGSAWTPVVPQSEIDSKIAASLITGSAQVLIGAANASVVALGGATEGQVLTAASAQPGGLAWQSPAGGGTAIYKYIAATGVTELPAPLTPGFYRLSTGTAVTYTQVQFRFLDQYGNRYGASLVGGTGYATIPVECASLDITVSPGFNLLAEEITGVSNILPAGPEVTDFGWTGVTGGSVAFTTAITPARVGYYNTVTGSLWSSSVVTSPFTDLNFTSATSSLGSDSRFVFIQQNADGVWSTSASLYAASAFDSLYPFQTFTANGTYTPPAWSSSVDVLVVAGGGAGGGGAASRNYGGGGGGGGASIFTDIATPASVAVTVGGGGAGSTGTGGDGSPSSFGSASVTGGGGGGGGSSATAGRPGGSGGGGNSAYPTGAGGAGSGIAGEGFPGEAGNYPSEYSGGGGGSGEPGGTDAIREGGDGAVLFGSARAGGGAGTSAYSGYPGGDGGGGGSNSAATGQPGTVNTGGGGGGGNVPPGNPSRAGGAGGSGIVIVKAKV